MELRCHLWGGGGEESLFENISNIIVRVDKSLWPSKRGYLRDTTSVSPRRDVPEVGLLNDPIRPFPFCHPYRALEASLCYPFFLRVSGVPESLRSNRTCWVPPGGGFGVEGFPPAEQLFISVLYVCNKARRCPFNPFSGWGGG